VAAQFPSHDAAPFGEGAHAPLRVLLAEDDPVARMLTARLLRKAGYEVIAAADGAEALAKLREEFCPILLTDWEMPGLDGPALVRHVREGEWPGYVFAILLTGRDGREHVIEGLEGGADDYLTKPVDEAELLARMKTARRVAELEQRLRAAQQAAVRQSLTDALTGAYNRRHLMEQLPREVERARRYGQPVSVLMCDIDFFKRVNDTHGHGAGDDVLVAFARMLGGAVRREIDCVARYGGEEFVVLMPQTDLAGALAAAEKLRAATESLEIETSGQRLHVTASFGVATLQPQWPEAPVVGMLLEQADACLYESKERGRNRVTGALVLPG
jgi:diguanylate cyclase (GGDEF)-like protein